MSDLRIIPTAAGDFDLEFLDGDFTLSDDLETAATLSLFTWTRRSPEDPNPDPNGGDMGWWADETLPLQGDREGSKLWLAHREKVTPDLLLRIKQWATEALAWFQEDQVVDRVAVAVDRKSLETGVVEILVEIARPGQDPTAHRYRLNWEAQASRRP